MVQIEMTPDLPCTPTVKQISELSMQALHPHTLKVIDDAACMSAMLMQIANISV